MKKYLLLLLCYCAPLYAGLGDPYTYSLPTPPSPDISPSPYDLPVPTRPTPAPTVPFPEATSLDMKLDSLWGPKKVRIQHAPTHSNQPVLCHVIMYDSICQSNSLHILTDQNALIKSPLERLTPESYVAVSGFTDYFDMRIQGTTSCTLNVSCKYLQQ